MVFFSDICKAGRLELSGFLTKCENFFHKGTGVVVSTCVARVVVDVVEVATVVVRMAGELGLRCNRFRLTFM